MNEKSLHRHLCPSHEFLLYSSHSQPVIWVWLETWIVRMRIEGAPDLNLKSVTVCIVESQVIKDMILSLILNQSTRPERLILCLYALFFLVLFF